MKVSITIKTDNAAFDDWGTEVARILRELAEKVEVEGTFCERVPILDVNGNKVGQFTIEN